MKRNYALLCLERIINPSEELNKRITPVLNYFKENDPVKTYDERDTENEISKAKIKFSEQCILVGKHVNGDPKKLLLIDFYTVIDMLQRKKPEN